MTATLRALRHRPSHNVGVYTSTADGSNEILIADLTQAASLLGWCRWAEK